MLAEYFHSRLVYDETAIAMMEETLLRTQKESLLQSLKKQALVPENAKVLYNHHGLAPGIIMEDEEKVCILLPGPPKEMEPMFEEYCFPYLVKKSHQVLVSLNIKLLDFDHAPVIKVGEAPVADALGDLLDSQNPTVATYAKDDGCLIRLTALAEDRKAALAMLYPLAEKIRSIIGTEYINYMEEEE
jgi:nicotinamide-nucleotide amidase